MQIVSLTTPQKITALAIFIGIAVIVVFVVMTEPRTAAANQQSQASSHTPAAAPGVSAGADRSQHITSPATAPTVSAQPQAQAHTSDSPKIDAWALGDAKSATPQIPLNRVIRDYEVIEINQHPATTPQVGETVSLPMLNGKKILVDVQTANLNPNGDKSWSGHLQGYGEDYPIIMTYGEHAIFATITTPEGSYTMESTDGVGWLYKNPSEFELSDASAKDFLEIPHSL